MKKTIILYMICLLCLPGSLAAQKTRELFIMHTSDTHSRIDPLDPHSSETFAGQGGVVRRASFIKKARQEHKYTLLFDCGDISQGTPYYNFFRGEVEVKAMNQMGYDAMAIGNHEFDFGLENMARIYQMANFPVVCSNYDFTGTVLEGIVKPYLVLKRGGVKIGVFSLSPPMEGLVQHSKCAGVVYKDPVKVANEMVDILRNKEHCDVVILLSHLGVVFNSLSPMRDYDNFVIPQTHGIDLVLGGHTHTYMEHPIKLKDADGKEIPLLHSGKNGAFVGCIKMELKKR